MPNTYFAPGDVMQMYDDEVITIDEGIGHLTKHLFNESNYNNGRIDKIEEEVLNLYSAFETGHITGKEYLNDLYRLTLRDYI